MRKCIALASILYLMCLGCALLSLDGESTEVVMRIGARNVGAHLVAQYPACARNIIHPAEAVLVGDEETARNFPEMLRGLILDKIDDPLLRADVRDLIGMITFKGGNIDRGEMNKIQQARIVRVVARGLLEGIRGGGVK